jgi:hypothetical protein
MKVRYKMEQEVFVLMTTSDRFGSPLLGVYATYDEAKSERDEIQDDYCLEDYELFIERSIYSFKFKEGV